MNDKTKRIILITVCCLLCGAAVIGIAGRFGGNTVTPSGTVSGSQPDSNDPNVNIQLKTEENPDMQHSLYHSAVDMYKGQLLPRCEHELWLMQLSMYYQSLYLQITKGYVRLKMECKDYILAQKTAIDALRFDPKDSELNMYAILAMGFQGNLSMAQTYYTAAKPYLALEHAEVIKKYLHIK